MTAPLDAPAAAARRQWVLDRLVEHLIAWGCPIDYAPARAGQLLATVTDAGYSLPTVLAEPVARRGPGSTPEARRQALEALAAVRARHREAQP